MKSVKKPRLAKKPTTATRNAVVSLSHEYCAAVCAASYLGKKGYTIPKEVLTKEDAEFLHIDLFLKPQQMGPQYGAPGDQDSTAFPVYRENDKKIYIPRFYGIARYGLPSRSELVAGGDIDIPFTKDLRDYQDKIIGIYMNHVSTSGKKGAILEVPCGRGKCLGKNTPIMMYDGSIKLVQRIRVGDVLMGDDSDPRHVLSLARGRELMYKIHVESGSAEPESYIVNESHILSLKLGDQVLDISILDYLSLNEELRSQMMGYRVPVLFESSDPQGSGPFNYYNVGKVASYQGNTIHRLSCCNDEMSQLTLIAGVIDAQALAKEGDMRYIIKTINNHRGFRSDVQFIARSLGFIANILSANPYPEALDETSSFDPMDLAQTSSLDDADNEEYDWETNTFSPRIPERDTYTYMEICSTLHRSIHEIPTLKMIPYVEPMIGDDERYIPSLKYPIRVEALDEDDYYGFEIDGNRRFLLGDFTVTHNTVMALKIASLVQKKTLIIVHKEFLMNQWIERAQEFVPSAKIGKIQGPVFDIEGKDIVLGMLQTLYDRDLPETAFDSFGLTIIDEVHRIGSQQFSKALLRIMTPYMLGISATVDRKDGLSKVLHMFIGDKIYTEAREDEDPVCVRGIEYISGDTHFNETEYDYRGNPKFSTMISKISEFGPRSDFIVRVLQDLIQECPRSQIMVLCHNRSLLTYFYKAIQHRGFATCGYYVGGMKQSDLQETEGKQIVLATYAMAAEALDIKTLSILVMASPKTDITQSVGRILRIRHENPIIVDIIDKHDIFQNQWKQRKTFYRKCNYKIMSTDSVRYRPSLNPGSWTTVFEPRSKKVGGNPNAAGGGGVDQEEGSKCLISFATLDLDI